MGTAVQKGLLGMLGIVLGGFVLTGCARSLMLSDSDSGLTKTGKVAARTVMGVCSIGLSEVEYAKYRKYQSWVGSNAQALIASWGPPTWDSPDGRGGRVITYIFRGSYTIPGQSNTQASAYAYSTSPYSAYAQGQSTTTYTPSTTVHFQKRVAFYVDSTGTIRNWDD